MKFQLFFYSLSLVLFQSCLPVTPEDYFDRTTLTTNKFFSFGAKDFDQMKTMKKGNVLYANVKGEITATESYKEHIETYKIPEIENDIHKIQDLKVTNETKDMIEASLEVFIFIKEKYENDYMKIAKLMDNNAPRKDISAAIHKLEEQGGPELDKRINKLMQVALPYAKNNGIRVNSY